MQEAAKVQMSYTLRNLFVSILTETSIKEVRALFDQFAESMTEDFSRRERTKISKLLFMLHNSKFTSNIFVLSFR